MGTGSEVEAGGLGWDVPDWGVCGGGGAALLLLLTEVLHGACSKAKVHGYGSTSVEVGPGLQVRYVSPSTFVPGILTGQVL